MFQPKRTKFKKFHKVRPCGIITNQSELAFGVYGLKVLKAGRISAKVLETLRRSITRKLKRKGQVWIRVFPDMSVTSKPAEVRMGKGKGSHDFWVASVKSGQIIFEIDIVNISNRGQFIWITCIDICI